MRSMLVFIMIKMSTRQVVEVKSGHGCQAGAELHEVAYATGGQHFTETRIKCKTMRRRRRRRRTMLL